MLGNVPRILSSTVTVGHDLPECGDELIFRQSEVHQQFVGRNAAEGSQASATRTIACASVSAGGRDLLRAPSRFLRRSRL